MKKKRVEWNVYLQPLQFSETHDYYPRVLLRDTVDVYDVLAARMAERSEYHVETIRGVLATMESLIEDYLIEGYAVSGKLGTLMPTVNGMWDFNRLDPSARAKNKAVVKYTMSTRLKESLSDPLFRLTSGWKSGPVINKVRNASADDDEQETWRPGDVLMIEGRFLLMNGEDPSRGIYFVEDETDAVAAHVPAGKMLLNNRSLISIRVPDLPSGRYRLRIVSQCTTSPRPLRTPKMDDTVTAYTVVGTQPGQEEQP